MIPQLTLRESALGALCLQQPEKKCQAVLDFYTTRDLSCIDSGANQILQIPPGTVVPGKPLRPHLKPPQDMPRRSPSTPQGHAALIHALAHIEFNAINLALDAVWRFDAMPQAFYQDWWRVAYEEAQHFKLLSTRLTDIGFQYGDFDAHNGLWELAEKTQHDLCARMALIPRTMEARGLDVTPGVREKFRQIGDEKTVAALDIILRDEVGHVRLGNDWFHWVCQQRGIEASKYYTELLEQYRAPSPKKPLNIEARLKAGFSTYELEQFNIPASSLSKK